MIQSSHRFGLLTGVRGGAPAGVWRRSAPGFGVEPQLPAYMVLVSLLIERKDLLDRPSVGTEIRKNDLKVRHAYVSILSPRKVR
ncbi:MAG: hypothetical protein GY696_03675 [Gammaproteobacteria bacterium]|nr:hypothetical protein [Gammaproteobacteria bacterium]